MLEKLGNERGGFGKKLVSIRKKKIFEKRVVFAEFLVQFYHQRAHFTQLLKLRPNSFGLRILRLALLRFHSEKKVK